MNSEYDYLRQNTMYGPGYGDPGSAARILSAYGINCATESEIRARVALLDRMGAFPSLERSTLRKAGFL